jgi:signal recognition particle subunit SRP54
MSGLQVKLPFRKTGQLSLNKRIKPLLVALIFTVLQQFNNYTLLEILLVEVYSEPENKNPVEIAQNAIKYAKEKGFDTVIVDTAGRLAVDTEMMDEISRVHKAIQPHETLFVVDAMTGQDAVNTAKL